MRLMSASAVLSRSWSCRLALLFFLVSPTLAVTPTWIWANPRPSGNNFVDLAYKNGLYVLVAEHGQLYTSFDLNFWERRDAHTTNALRAATFLGSRIIITGEQGVALYGDSPTNLNLVDLGTSDWLESVAASADQLVAVGDNAAIYTSLNGVNWERQSAPFTDWLRGVAYGNNLFVTVGENGRIATSSNGSDWKIRQSGTTA
ncbi:MAG: hypothetical protein M1608_00870, partial [Candidatus Omnitrophica bacterium]|nr:hypothetical protein [Candidatus Omnitrophota bacterium]